MIISCYSIYLTSCLCRLSRCHKWQHWFISEQEMGSKLSFKLRLSVLFEATPGQLMLIDEQNRGKSRGQLMLTRGQKRDSCRGANRRYGQFRRRFSPSEHVGGRRVSVWQRPEAGGAVSKHRRNDDAKAGWRVCRPGPYHRSRSRADRRRLY
jgi:hypothetical protein